MEIRENEPLEMYTTFRMGGVAEKLYAPESVEELTALLTEQSSLYKYIISGGSNLLINDDKRFPAVLSMRKANLTLEHRGDGIFYIGASVRIQEAIQFVNGYGRGGMEYLYSLPALMGGILYMNAGRGKKDAKAPAISDYVVSVDILDNGIRRSLTREECSFSYRESVFQRMEKCVILGGLFQFPEMTSTESAALIRERIALCRNTQDMTAPNFGSVFCTFNPRILRMVRKVGFGSKKGCHFSTKTANWMLHEKGGSFRQAVSCINTIKTLHKLAGKKCETEVRIWE